MHPAIKSAFIARSCPTKLSIQCGEPSPRIRVTSLSIFVVGACKIFRTQQSAAMHDPKDRSFLGHPRGLGYIAFAEAWERLSYYGMQALLVLYMVNRLLHPGHIERIAGFGPFRHLIDKEGKVFRSDVHMNGRQSSVAGIFDAKIDNPTSKGLTGTAKTSADEKKRSWTSHFTRPSNSRVVVIVG
jgi:hypothetical protein